MKQIRSLMTQTTSTFVSLLTTKLNTILLLRATPYHLLGWEWRDDTVIIAEASSP